MSVEIEFPLEVWLHGVPPSHQAGARSRAQWRERIAAAIEPKLPEGRFVPTAPVVVTIYYFAGTAMRGDLDNIVKPILDALTGVVYLDDAQVERIVVQKIEQRRTFTFRNATPILTETIEASGPRVYIRVELSESGAEV